MSEYQGYFADCYVLSDKRTTEFIYQFLDRFIPNRKESAGAYEVGQYDEGTFPTFKSVQDTIAYLVDHPTLKHSLYWENPDAADLRGIELFFTDDAHVIMGIYCETKYPNTEIENQLFKALQDFCGSKEGYIAYETPPPFSSVVFKQNIETMS